MNNYWYIDLIHKYIPPNSQAYPIYIIHVTLVTEKAISIARRLNLPEESIRFIEEAGMLHDIGICKTEDKHFGTHGGEYITHGITGAEILRSEGYPKHARVAENHTGVGLYVKQIIDRNLPLPHRDFVPESIEEKIISFADLFWTKNTQYLWQELPLSIIKEQIGKYGPEYSSILESWIAEFLD